MNLNNGYDATMKSFRMATIVALTWLALPVAHAQFIDTFSTSTAADAPNYTPIVEVGSPANAATFAINGSGQLQPTTAVQLTSTDFFRNTAQLSYALPGESVSVTIDYIAVSGSDGLAFTPSLAGFSFFPLAITNVTGDAMLASGAFSTVTFTSANPATTLDALDFSGGKTVLENVVRTGNTFAFSFTGTALQAPITGTLTDTVGVGSNLYMGVGGYSGSTGLSPGAQIADNFTFRSVPEPSTYAMMLLGAFGLLVIARRHRRTING
jgi:hypothetical protein